MPGPKKVCVSILDLNLEFEADYYSDHEIFRLRDEVELYEGEGTTFYG